MIAHITTTGVFLASIKSQFEVIIPGRNRYYVFDDKVLSEEIINDITYLSFRNLNYKKLELEINKCSALIIHFASSPLVHVLNKISIHIPFAVSLGGIELYPRNVDKLRILERETKSQFFTIGDRIYHHVISVKQFFSSESYYNQLRQLLKKASFAITVIPEENEILKKNLGDVKKVLTFNYGDIEVLKNTSFSPTFKNNSNIWIGNSCTLSSNYVEVFKSLSSLNFKKAFVSLSYGELEYQTKIIDLGKEILKDRLVPVTRFFSKLDYFEILASCGITILNHKRQQGLGNVITSLWFGHKVFLNSENPIFRFFRSRGAIIYNFKKELDIMNSSINDDMLNVNRQILNDYFSEDACLSRTKNIVKNLL